MLDNRARMNNDVDTADGTLTIPGTGAVSGCDVDPSDHRSATAPWGKGVKATATAFFDCDGLAAVILPDSGTNIKNGAFRQMKSGNRMSVPLAICVDLRYNGKAVLQ